jgi:hypothetical protein
MKVHFKNHNYFALLKYTLSSAILRVESELNVYLSAFVCVQRSCLIKSFQFRIPFH